MSCPGLESVPTAAVSDSWDHKSLHRCHLLSTILLKSLPEIIRLSESLWDKTFQPEKKWADDIPNMPLFCETSHYLNKIVKYLSIEPKISLCNFLTKEKSL